jgi:hypothetical protein
LNLTINTPSGFLLGAAAEVFAAGAALAAGAMAPTSIITINNVLNHLAFMNYISSMIVLNGVYIDACMHFDSIENQHLLKQKTAELKNLGGLAVCQPVRISLADP